MIDVAFSQVRPSPWRQAADLANMMLVLAIRSSPEQVYERALRLFTPHDIAEAFAATSEVTRPSLHKMMRSAGEDLVACFRELAPAHSPIKVQRWSLRRIGLTAGVALSGLLAIAMVTSNLHTAGLL